MNALCLYDEGADDKVIFALPTGRMMIVSLYPSQCRVVNLETDLYLFDMKFVESKGLEPRTKSHLVRGPCKRVCVDDYS